MIARILILTFFLLATSLSIAATPKRVWVDTDIMIGKFGRDVDDGLALMLLLASEDIEIVGISLTQGVDHGYKVTQKLVNWYGKGKQIPIYKGAINKEEAGAETEAVKAMKAAFEKESLTLVSLGPATNIATLLTLYPELESQIEKLLMCMGRRPGMTFDPGNGKKNLNDYNFDLDPYAMKIILATEIPITLSCYEASSYIYLNSEDIKVLKGSRREGDKWVYKQLKSWRKLWKTFLGSKQGFIPFDAVTVAHLTAPQYFEYNEDIPVEIQTRDNDSNYKIKTTTKPYLLVSYDFESERKVSYCYKTDVAFKEYLLGKLIGK